jgi:hypothetical protein
LARALAVSRGLITPAQRLSHVPPAEQPALRRLARVMSDPEGLGELAQLHLRDELARSLYDTRFDKLTTKRRADVAFLAYHLWSTVRHVLDGTARELPEWEVATLRLLEEGTELDPPAAPPRRLRLVPRQEGEQ